jgi:arylsulfatase A-like enzyme
VPLLVAWNGHVPAGQRIADPVSLRDIPATVLGLALPGTPAALPGRSLLSSAEAPIGSRPIALSEVSLEEFTRTQPAMRNGALQSLVGDGWQYVRAANGHEEVYWTGMASPLVDTAVTLPAARSAIVDSARSRLTGAGIPAPRDSVR